MGAKSHFFRFIVFAIILSIFAAAVTEDRWAADAKLIKKVNPVYPDAARHAHISGSVVAEVTIGTKGEVTDVRPVAGDSMLVDPVVNPVWQWQYSPSYLNPLLSKIDFPEK